MAGFGDDNAGMDVVFADNVDFSGAITPTGRILSDGQLLIGSSTLPNIRVNTLTGGSGIAVANGHGTITISLMSGGAVLFIQGNSGGKINPDITNTINILTANSTVKFVGTANTETLDFGANNNLLLGTAGPSIAGATNNTSLGFQCFPAVISATQCSAVGFQTLQACTTGSYNTAFGSQCLKAIVGSSQNSGFGVSTGAANSDGGDNVYFGFSVASQMPHGSQNVMIGSQAGNNILGTANNNTLIGYKAGSNYVLNESNNIILGENIAGTASENNVIRIGNASNASCFVTGIQGVTVTSPVGFVNINANGQMGSTASVVQTLSDDVGTSITPSSNNIQLVGHVVEQGATKFSTVVAGSHLANINPMSSSRWIVDPLGFNGTHTTIASAITSATSGDTIFLLPGTYTENLTLAAGVNLTAYNCDSTTPNVTISGKCTFTGAGTVSISGIRLQTNSDFLLAVTGSAASIVNLIDCYLNCTNNTGISYTSSSGSSNINIYQCKGDLGTTGIMLFAHSSAGDLEFKYCIFTNTGSSTTASTQSAGSMGAEYSRFASPITTSSTGLFSPNYSTFDTSSLNVTAFTDGGSAATANYCQFASGTASAISIGGNRGLRMCHVNSTNTNAITGAGTLRNIGIQFSNTSSTINTTTISNTGGALVASSFIFPNGVQIISGTGSPSGSVTAPQGSLYLRTDGSSTSTRAYINTNSGTTWTAITTAA